MVIFAIVMSSLALVAAVSAIVLTVCFERKRNQTWKADLTNVHAAVSTVQTRVEDIAKGIVPDYEKAKAAAEAVNSFSDGITNILNFDPMQEIKRQRENRGDND